MSWTDSRTIRYLIFTWLGTVLLQLYPMLQAHKFDWWAIGAESVASLAGILIRMAQPDVQAPAALNAISLGFLNRNNVLTVPPSSVPEKPAGG